MSIYDDFLAILNDKDKISKNSLLKILKKHAKTLSVFDLMTANGNLLNELKYVQGKFNKDTHEIYTKYFILRIKNVIDDNKQYNGIITKEEISDSLRRLEIYQEERNNNKFSLIYVIISLYTAYILQEPIHPVGTPFPGSLKVIEDNGIYYCPVKEANLDSPSAVCKMCIAEQLEF